IGAEGSTVATGTTDVLLGNLATLLGAPLDARDLHGLREGDALDRLAEDRARALSELSAGICRHEEFWKSRLADLEPIEMPLAKRRAPAAPLAPHAVKQFATPASFLRRFEAAPGDALLAALLAYLSRICGKTGFTVPFRHAGL